MTGLLDVDWKSLRWEGWKQDEARMMDSDRSEGSEEPGFLFSSSRAFILSFRMTALVIRMIVLKIAFIPSRTQLQACRAGAPYRPGCDYMKIQSMFLSAALTATPFKHKVSPG